MASPKKRVNPLFVALAVVLVAVVVAVGVVFFQLHSKISALQTGASFTFRYEITPNSPDKPPLLNILDRVNASSGSISGQYAPGKLQLSFYQLNEDDSVKTSPFTRVYIDSEETLFDIGQLYTVLRQAVTDKLSIASVLLPEWSLGDYISQTQASAVLGVETNKVELQELSGFTLSLKGLKKASPSAARDGYRYYQFPAAADGTTLVLGFSTDALFSKTTPIHVLLTIPDHNVHIQLTGTVTSAKTVLSPPASRMSDEDIATLAQIRQSIESVWKMIQSATQTTNCFFVCAYLPVEDTAIHREGDDIPGDELTAVLEGSDGGVFETSAARHLHPQDGNALDVVIADDLGQLLAVVHGIQLGAADEGNMAAHELLMDVRVGVGGAVGGDKQLGTVKIGCIHRHELDLAGPLGQLRGLGGGRSCSRCGLLAVKLAHGAARAAVEDGLFGSGSSLFLFVFQHSLLIVGSGLPLLEGDGTGGAAGQAVAEAVAVVVAHKLGLSVHEADGTLMAGSDTGTTAIAFFFVYMNDFTYHIHTLLFLMGLL